MLYNHHAYGKTQFFLIFFYVSTQEGGGGIRTNDLPLQKKKSSLMALE